MFYADRLSTLVVVCGARRADTGDAAIGLLHDRGYLVPADSDVSRSSIQPRWPTQAGRQKRRGPDPIVSSCTPRRQRTRAQRDRRHGDHQPGNKAPCLPRTKNVTAPWLTRFCPLTMPPDVAESVSCHEHVSVGAGQLILGSQAACYDKCLSPGSGGRRP
jgi:hypothetical protein